MKNLNIFFDLLLFPFIFLMSFSLSLDSNTHSYQGRWKRGEKVSLIFILLGMFFLSSVSNAASKVDLEILKFALGEKVKDKNYTIVPSDTNFTYAIFVINHSHTNANNVTVTDIFPDGNVSYVTYDKGTGWDCNISNTLKNTGGAFNCEFNRTMGHEITYFTITALAGGDDNATATNEINISSVFPISEGHDMNASATVLIRDTNTSSSYSLGNYPKGGSVEVSDLDISLLNRSNALLYTKVASTLSTTIPTYFVKNGVPSPYDSNITVAAKTIPLTVILKLTDDNCSRENETYLVYNDSNYNDPVVAIFGSGVESVNAGTNSQQTFDLRNIAMRRSRIIMKYIDMNAILDVSGESCNPSNLSTNIKGIPQCIANGASSNSFDNNKYLRVFGIEAFVRCTINNGQPCSSVNHGVGDDPYNNDYGCYECTLGGAGYCSNDNFAIRPKKFYVNISEVLALNDGVLKAGKDYNLIFEGLTDIGLTSTPNETTLDYNETQVAPPGPPIIQGNFSADANVTNNTNCEVKYLTNDPLVHFQNGIHDGNFSFDDIGDINFTIHETNGTEFAIIDVDDTPNLDDRLIKKFNAVFTVIPDHFYIEANLIDHNSASQFTYLHDFNRSASEATIAWIKSNYTGTMAAILDINVSARGYSLTGDGNITSNYTEGCYAKETDLNLTINESNITHAGSTTSPALSQFIYYNDINESEGNYSLPAPVNDIITIKELFIEKNAVNFLPNAPDGNGTAHPLYRIDFDRKMNRPVNPFRLEMIDANITDEDNVTGIDTDDSNATFYFARAESSKYFYDDVTDHSVNTPISVVVYSEPASSFGLDILLFKPINEYDWYLSTTHTSADGNLTLNTDSKTTLDVSSQITKIYSDLSNGIFKDSSGADVTVFDGGGTRPYTSDINLTGTDRWLIYNPSADSEPTPFYRVRFIGTSDWAGHGDTGHVVEDDPSTKKNRRLGW